MSEVVIIDLTRAEDSSFNSALTEQVEGYGFDVAYTPHQNLDDLRTLAQVAAAHSVIIAGVPFHYPAESAEELESHLQPWLPITKVPTLGICLGHQAMALAFGATMRRNIEIEKGNCVVEIADEHRQDPLFAGLDRINAEELHWASVSIENTELLRLARSFPQPGSTGCENQVIKVPGRNIYGTQFHPEKSEDGKLLLRNFLQL